MARADAEEVVHFAEGVMQLLDRGGFVATYKYAVLLGLMDLCIEGTSRGGSAPSMVTTRQLADKVIELYWPQTRQFSARGAGATGPALRQNTGRQAKIVSDIVRFREALPDPSTSRQRARLEAREPWESLVDRVEWTLIHMPLPRLHTVGGVHRELLYRIGWDLGIERRKRLVTGYQRSLRQGGGSSPSSAEFDNRIMLLPGVGERLVLLNTLLRPLIHREWARLVARINKLEEAQLESFLFGAARVPTRRLAAGLRELQQGRCFYCADRLRGPVEVDHFIPWARHPNDAIENLVVAHGRCNRHKRDFLAATDHVAHWVERLDPSASASADLVILSRRHGWDSARSRTVGVARGVYLRLREDALLWREADDFVRADPQAIRLALGAAA